MVLDERNLHPALCGEVVVGIIIHSLPADGQVLPTGQVVLVLVVPHPHLVPTLEEIAVRLVNKDVRLLQLVVQLHL